MGDFADSVGINRSTLSLIVNGKTLPNFTNAYIIAQNLKIPIEKYGCERSETNA